VNVKVAVWLSLGSAGRLRRAVSGIGVIVQW
jgi:hypothetical protein